MTNYSSAPIAALINALDEDGDAFVWLIENKFPELALFAKYMRDEEGEDYDKLLNSDHRELAAFIDALHYGDSGAVNFLLSKKFNALAAVVNSVQGDREAYEWLLANQLPHYAKLADTLRNILRPPSRTSGVWP
jgi:hypothetical protein